MPRGYPSNSHGRTGSLDRRASTSERQDFSQADLVRPHLRQLLSSKIEGAVRAMRVQHVMHRTGRLRRKRRRFGSRDGERIAPRARFTLNSETISGCSWHNTLGSALVHVWPHPEAVAWSEASCGIPHAFAIGIQYDAWTQNYSLESRSDPKLMF